MRTQKISFPDQPALCVFPQDHSELAQAIKELHLNGSYPVIVLIGGEIEEEYTAITKHAIHTISKVAEEIGALVICGGTDMGVMAEIGQARWRDHYKFPLIGVAPEDLVSWPGGPSGKKILWWGKKRWPLADHYSRFILVPGSQFGDESLWIVEAASMLSSAHRSVTILINGGEVSRKDIELSLANGRPVIVLSGTGRLADELANRTDQQKLLTIVPVIIEQRIADEIKTAITGI
jgi:hypothetical protein